MIVEVKQDVYLLIIHNIESIFTHASGFDMFVRKNGRWFINTGGKPDKWSNALTDKYQIILECQFISERREQVINELV